MNERVARFLAETVGECPYCAAKVRRDAPRGLDHAGRLAHLACLDGEADGVCVHCAKPVTRREESEQTADHGLLHKTCAEAHAAKGRKR